ncbi:unnamed protein product [Fraxinus pennsylvanica]|uniref:Uncharacterized protein n=1 Tax=Fraxinus pennsylvanica TaxID=56036 RepID=A0AAD1ZTA2_9LAMI|nr:unnamed protein product [Fraxinus pennsylvanica]
MATHRIHGLNLCGVLSETKRIIGAHSRHFLALSVLFLLPLSFSAVIYPTLQTAFSEPNSSVLSHFHRSFYFFLDNTVSNPQNPHLFLFPLVYTVFVFVFSLLATASVTYSAFHGFYGRPVKLVSSLKSVLYSVLPLFVTFVVIDVIVGLIVLGFGVFVGLVYKGVKILGFEIDYESNYFLGFAVFVMVLLVSGLIYLTVEWSLAYVVVVVESKWGFTPLKRSARLIKGMRWVALAMMMLFGILIGLFAMAASSLVLNAESVQGGWLSWAFVLQTVVYSGFMTILMLYSVAAHTVLYMYCKALHGELAFDIAAEFAREYVSLPFDDGKVPHVVYVVPN